MNYLNPRHLAAAFILLLCAAPASAALICNAMATPVQMVYFENDPNPTTGAWSVTINCTRGPADPTTSAYTLRADDGFNRGTGSNNQAVNGTGTANQMAYDLFRTAPGTGEWGYSNTTDFAGTVNFGSALTASINHVFYSRIAAGLNKNAKTFGDTVTMRLRYDNGSGNVQSSVLLSGFRATSAQPGAVWCAFCHEFEASGLTERVNWRGIPDTATRRYHLAIWKTSHGWDQYVVTE